MEIGLLAESCGARPSALLGVTDEWAAYQFDYAALVWVEHVKGEVRGGKKLKRVLEADKVDARQKHSGMTKAGEFAAWAELGPVRKVRIREDGTW